MNSDFSFDIIARHGRLARAGVIHTPHGDILTPTFSVVGTHGAVKFLTPEQLRSTGAQVMLSNAYHLYRRADEIDAAGGLAEFSGWREPTITDSGGFQVMSLGSGLGKVVSMDKRDVARKKQKTVKEEDRLAHVTDHGVTFHNPIDGQVEEFTPELSMQIQHQIGADIMMAFDELTSIGDDYDYNVQALERTRMWAERCLAEHRRLTIERANKPYQALYGVLQGAHYQDLREKAARDLGAMDFDGYGLGGAFEKERLGDILRWTNSILPEAKPRHLLGLSKPDDIFVGVENGADTFDCVAPTREARHGRIYTLDGDINLRRAEFASDERPLDPECDCLTCHENYSRASLRQMLKSPDIATRATAFSLLSQHNVRFVVRLMEQICAAIIDGSFDELRSAWLARYYDT